MLRWTASIWRVKTYYPNVNSSDHDNTPTLGAILTDLNHGRNGVRFPRNTCIAISSASLVNVSDAAKSGVRTWEISWKYFLPVLSTKPARCYNHIDILSGVFASLSLGMMNGGNNLIPINHHRHHHSTSYWLYPCGHWLPNLLAKRSTSMTLWCFILQPIVGPTRMPRGFSLAFLAIVSAILCFINREVAARKKTAFSQVHSSLFSPQKYGLVALVVHIVPYLFP